MIVEEGKKVKIIDFGSAKDIKEKVWSKGNSSTGRSYFEHFMGTPNYMPVECIRNKFSNKKCDVFALGCIYYNLVTGYPAFLGGSQYLIFKEIIDNQYPKFYDYLFSEFEIDLMKKMLNPEAEKRPSIREVLEMCKNWSEIKFTEIP